MSNIHIVEKNIFFSSQWMSVSIQAKTTTTRKERIMVESSSVYDLLYLYFCPIKVSIHLPALMQVNMNKRDKKMRNFMKYYLVQVCWIIIFSKIGRINFDLFFFLVPKFVFLFISKALKTTKFFFSFRINLDINVLQSAWEFLWSIENVLDQPMNFYARIFASFCVF